MRNLNLRLEETEELQFLIEKGDFYSVDNRSGFDKLGLVSHNSDTTDWYGYAGEFAEG
jgi:hypothetical protein